MEYIVPVGSQVTVIETTSHYLHIGQICEVIGYDHETKWYILKSTFEYGNQYLRREQFYYKDPINPKK